MSQGHEDPADEQQREFDQQQAELAAKNRQIMVQKLLALKRANPGDVNSALPANILTGSSTLGSPQ